MIIRGMLSVFAVSSCLSAGAASAAEEDAMYRFGDVVGRYKAFAAVCGGPSADAIQAEAFKQAHALYPSHSRVAKQFQRDIDRGYRSGRRKVASADKSEVCTRFWPASRATYNRAMGRRQDAEPTALTPTNDRRASN